MVVALLFASRHLKNTKVQNNYSCVGSNSLNWRSDTTKNSINESNNYGYTNHYVASAFYMLVGLDVEIQKCDGNIYEGILETISSKVEFHLSHAYQKSSSSNQDTTHKNEKLIDKIIFPFCDVLYCRAKSVDLDFAKREALLTDSAISGSNGSFNERELVQWEPEDAVNALTQELEETDMNDGWAFDDMMRVNEEKHGVKSTFDSSMSSYMTPIEKLNEDEYRALDRRAEQVAREIQNDPKFKELEIIDSGVAEEELFSAVSRAPPASPSNSSSSVNNSSDSIDNDGFISYTGKSYHKRLLKGQNAVAPRLQRISNMRNQDPQSHNSNSNHQVNRNHISPQRSQNGNAPRNNSYQHQTGGVQTHQSPTHGHIENYRKAPLPAQQPQENVPPLTNIRTPVDAPNVPRPLSYSAAAMKKNPQTNNRMYSGGKNTIPVQPVTPDMTQPVHQPESFSSLPPNSTNLQSPVVANGHLTPAQKMVQPRCISQEALAAAKQQVIQESKKKANMSHNIQTAPAIPPTTLPSTQMTTPHTTCSPLTTAIHQTAHSQVNRQASPPTAVKSNSLTSATMHCAVVDMKEKDRLSPAKVVSNADKSQTTSTEDKPETSSFSNLSPKEQRSRLEDGKLQYHSKLEKKGSSIKDLKKFGEQFKLPDPKPKKQPTTKSVDIPSKPVEVSKPEPVASTISDSATTATLHPSPQSSPRPVVTTAAVSSSVTLVSTVTVASATTTANVLSSPDSAALQKYSLNPSAKEFNPVKEAASPSPKPPVTKQPHPGEIALQHTVVQQQQQQATYYGGTVVINAPEVISPTVQSMPVKQIFARPYMPSGPGGAAVYSIPAMEFSNNGNNGGPQLIAAPPSGFIPAQNISAQQVIFLHGGPNGPASYQPVVNSHGQHYYSMQQMIRCVPSHPSANGVQQSQNRLPSNFQQEGSPGGYVLAAVSQHGGMVQHQGGPTNQHQGYHPPQSPASSHMQPQYVMSHQVANSFPQNPQNASQITYTQGATTSAYRSPSAGPHHPQQPLYMMTHQGQHMQAVAMQNNQTFVPGQQHGGILSNYQTGN